MIVACFGQDLKPDYKSKIGNLNFLTFRHLTIKHRSLGITVTPKVHLLETHASEFLEMMGGEHGLGYYSEQAMESMHKDLKKEWQGEKLDENHPNYPYIDKMHSMTIFFVIDRSQ